MLPTKKEVLFILNAFKNEKNIVKKKQSFDDIIKGILHTHELYKSEYDKIYNLFLADSYRSILQKIFIFLKTNVPYKAEPSHEQTLRSPSAILEYNNSADCKSYALFTNGILDAIRRNENEDFEIIYRFAGYENLKNIEHVFSVAKFGDIEFWNDAVLNEFDSREKIPTFTQDKKIRPMLVQVNGFNNAAITSQKLSILEQLRPQPSYLYVGKQNIDTAFTSIDTTAEYFAKARYINNALKNQSYKRIGGDDEDSGIDWLSPTGVVSKIIDFISNIFGGSDPEKDWETWDGLDQRYGNYPPGGQAKYHIQTMGTKTASSIARTMPNLLSWVRSKGVQRAFEYWRNFPDTNKLTPMQIYEAFKIGGMEEAGKDMANAYNKFLNPNAKDLFQTANSTSGGNTPTSATSPVVPLGLAFLAYKLLF